MTTSLAIVRAAAAAPALERTAVPGVYRLLHGERLGIDVANFKAQRAADGYVSFEDAAARGISRSAWDAAISNARNDQERLDNLVRLFAAQPVPKAQLRRADGSVLEVERARAEELKHALAVLRSEGGEPPAALGLSAAEKGWLLEELRQKTVRVELPDGRAHYMTPEMQQRLDANVAQMFEEIQKQRAAGKKVVYLSTFISAVDPKTNRAIAARIVERMADDSLWSNAWVLNPAGRQVISGALGDDYMYMWQKLIRMNVFDAVRFTSTEDTKEYFARPQGIVGKVLALFGKTNKVPKDYAFSYGDMLHSVGCRLEWNLFVDINRALAASGHADKMVPFYHGTDPVEATQLTQRVDVTTYEKRGEIVE